MPFAGRATGSSERILSALPLTRTIEQMLENMFVGRPPGNYDRLLISVERSQGICSLFRQHFP